MQSISLFTKLPEVKKKGSERGDLLQYFTDTIKDRKGKPYRIAYIAMRLSHLQVKDLYYLQSLCKQSNNFERTFWGSLKAK